MTAPWLNQANALSLIDIDYMAYIFLPGAIATQWAPLGSKQKNPAAALTRWK